MRNTDPKTNRTREGALSHPEQSPYNNPRKLYEVTLILKQESAGVLIVPAKSRKQAAETASLLVGQVQDWEPFAETVSIESVKLMKEGKNHE